MRILWGAPLVLALLSTSALASETVGYSYDALGRLSTTTRSGTINNGVQSSVTYDNAGNRTNYSVAGVVGGVLSIAAATVTEGGNLLFTVSRGSTATGIVSVNYATADGTALAGARYAAASGVLTFRPSDISQTITVPTIDDSLIEGAQTMSVSLSNPTGGAALGTASATGTISDNDAVQFAISSAATITEGGALVYTVTRSGTTGGTFSVNYATADGTAVAGSDYNATSGTLTFQPSETSKTISVGTIDDASPEPAKTVLVNLSAPGGGATIATAQASGTINDNDTTPITFSISNPTAVTEGSLFAFTVTKSGSTYATTSVNYSTADGSANAGTDYTAASSTLTFAPSDTSKIIYVATRSDSIAEPSETMKVNLSNAVGGSISSGQAIGTIIDVPPPPSFSVSDASVTEGGTMVFTITKSNATTGTASVSYQTLDNLAKYGSDYTRTTGTLTFAPSEMTKTIGVQTIDDSTVEGTENLVLQIYNSVGGTISRSMGDGIIYDNDQPPAPTFSVSDAVVTEGGALVFTVTKTGATSSTLTTTYSTGDGTAKAGSDYTATSGSLTFGPSDTVKTFAVGTIDDTIIENPETLYVNMGGNVQYTKFTGTGTINDNDVGNAPPITASDTGSTKVCNAVSVNVVANDTDPEGDYPLTVVGITTNSLGSASIKNGTDIFFSAGSRTGTAGYTYTVRDSRGASSTGSLIITIGNGNDCK
jgi:YD repeat-containing protein